MEFICTIGRWSRLRGAPSLRFGSVRFGAVAHGLGDTNGVDGVTVKEHQPAVSALAQAFYASRFFRRLRLETRDYRQHPVLGGISSTRWHAYDRFTTKQSFLVDQLKDRDPFDQVIDLTRDRKNDGEKLLAINQPQIQNVFSGKGQLDGEGLLSGDSRSNRLKGSKGDDVLMGEGGNDRLFGGRGSDLLIGGAGSDRFTIKRNDRRGDLYQDTIVDFDPDGGDQLVIRGATQFVGMQPFSGQAGEVQSMVWMVDLLPGHQGEIHPWMIQGVTLAIDDDGDRRADAIIEIPGLSEFQSGWLKF